MRWLTNEFTNSLRISRAGDGHGVFVEHFESRGVAWMQPNSVPQVLGNSDLTFRRHSRTSSIHSNMIPTGKTIPHFVRSICNRPPAHVRLRTVSRLQRLLRHLVRSDCLPPSSCALPRHPARERSVVRRSGSATINFVNDRALYPFGGAHAVSRCMAADEVAQVGR